MKKSPVLLGIFALLFAVAAPASWVATLDDPFLRRTGASAWLLIAVSLSFAFAAWRLDSRWRTRVTAVLAILANGVFPAVFLVASRVPAATAPGNQALAPDFSLPDTAGKLVALRDATVRGPTLVTFFRGHW